MQVQATYENGRLIFRQPIRLKISRIEVEVTIPDSVVANEEPFQEGGEIAQIVSPIRQQLDAIAGKYAKRRPAISPDFYKGNWHQHLMEKYLSK